MKIPFFLFATILLSVYGVFAAEKNEPKAVSTDKWNANFEEAFGKVTNGSMRIAFLDTQAYLMQRKVVEYRISLLERAKKALKTRVPPKPISEEEIASAYSTLLRATLFERFALRKIEEKPTDLFQRKAERKAVNEKQFEEVVSHFGSEVVKDSWENLNGAAKHPRQPSVSSRLTGCARFDKRAHQTSGSLVVGS